MTVAEASRSFEVQDRRRTADAIRETLEQISRDAGVEKAIIAYVDAPKRVLRGAHGYNMPSYLLDWLNLPLDDTGPLIQAALHGKAASVEDVTADPRITDLMREYWSGAGIRCFIALPLLAGSAVAVFATDGPPTDRNVANIAPYLGRLAMLTSQSLPDLPLEPQPFQFEEERSALWFMLNTVPDPVVLSDEQNNILLENVHAERLFKASVEDVEGRRYAVEMNSFLFTAALSSFYLDQSNRPGRELTLVDPIEGTELLYEVIVQSLSNRRSGGREFVSFLHNVTDLRRAVTELEQSLRDIRQTNETVRQERDRLNLILENVETPIVVFGPGSDLLLMNSAASRLLQPSEARTSRRRITAYSTNDAKLTSFLAEFQLDPSDLRRSELQLIDPESGEEISVSITATRTRSNVGEHVGVVCVLHDLTRIKELERQRLERQLSESEKLAAVGRLAAAVAHEVNNPLESIKNALSLVVSKTPSEAPTRRFLDIANTETQRVSTIIRQMLNFYRSDTVRKPVAVGQVLRDVITILNMQFGKSVTWHIQIDRSLPMVNASEDKLKQVFLNLMINAREAMDGGPGELDVVARLSNTSDLEFTPGNYVMVEISDTGRGIAEEDLARIFDPFFSTKKGGHGTGLGLWVSQDIVQQHGGHIQARSRAGHGATFTVALPIGSQDGG
ncbi:MAG: PAS domain S-box protein [Chloroflexi bacterium]|nr:PAS domain S-box protein [Chloroflexota bacterium]